MDLAHMGLVDMDPVRDSAHSSQQLWAGTVNERLPKRPPSGRRQQLRRSTGVHNWNRRRALPTGAQQDLAARLASDHCANAINDILHGERREQNAEQP